MSLIKREEYYVSYFDTEDRYYYSPIFTEKAKAEFFLKSVLSLGACKAEIKKMEYFYETGQ